MTERQSVPPAPAPLEAHAQQFDALFGKVNQRAGFRLSGWESRSCGHATRW